MKKIKLANLIKEEIKKTLLQQGNVKKFLAKPSDGADVSNIMLTLKRSIKPPTAFYRLQTDGWFRRYSEPGKGFGVAIRKFKVDSTPIRDDKVGFTKYKVQLKYLPTKFDDPDDDTSKNWGSAKGYLILYDQINEQINVKQIQNFVNQNIKKYKP